MVLFKFITKSTPTYKSCTIATPQSLYFRTKKFMRHKKRIFAIRLDTFTFARIEDELNSSSIHLLSYQLALNIRIIYYNFQTATTVTTVLYHLATHPEKQSKLRKELGSKDEKQSYLKACIKESLRLNPVVIGNLRLTTKEYNILGYNIPKQVRK